MKTELDAPTDTLIKHDLAERLRAAIVGGALLPGERIVEGTWARKFGVAQASIREAINLLIAEGFVTKASGRSARAVHFTEQDVLHIYDLRGALEGLAARLTVENKRGSGPLRQALDTMRAAAQTGDSEALLAGDLEFHLQLCRGCGNPYVHEHAKRLLLPLFSFVRMRVTASGQSTEAWERDLAVHQRIIDLIDEGEAELAEQYVKRAMARFGAAAYDNWEKRPQHVR